MTEAILHGENPGNCRVGVAKYKNTGISYAGVTWLRVVDLAISQGHGYGAGTSSVAT